MKLKNRKLHFELLTRWLSFCFFAFELLTRWVHFYFLTFDLHLFFNKQSIFHPHSENCLSFSKKSPPKIVWQLFDRWSINFYFKYSSILLHSLLQGHLQHVMHTFELTSPKASISLRFPMQKKGFTLFSQWIV